MFELNKHPQNKKTIKICYILEDVVILKSIFITCPLLILVLLNISHLSFQLIKMTHLIFQADVKWIRNGNDRSEPVNKFLNYTLPNFLKRNSVTYIQLIQQYFLQQFQSDISRNIFYLFTQYRITQLRILSKEIYNALFQLFLLYSCKFLPAIKIFES